MVERCPVNATSLAPSVPWKCLMENGTREMWAPLGCWWSLAAALGLGIAALLLLAFFALLRPRPSEPFYTQLDRFPNPILSWKRARGRGRFAHSAHLALPALAVSGLLAPASLATAALYSQSVAAWCDHIASRLGRLGPSQGRQRTARELSCAEADLVVLEPGAARERRLSYSAYLGAAIVRPPLTRPVLHPPLDQALSWLGALAWLGSLALAALRVCRRLDAPEALLQLRPPSAPLP